MPPRNCFHTKITRIIHGQKNVLKYKKFCAVIVYFSNTTISKTFIRITFNYCPSYILRIISLNTANISIHNNMIFKNNFIGYKRVIQYNIDNTFHTVHNFMVILHKVACFSIVTTHNSVLWLYVILYRHY